MSERWSVVIRSKRRITIPAKICNTLEVKPGESLELSVENSALVIRPGKRNALRTLEEIERVFKSSGVTEEVLQEVGRKVRKEIVKERYGNIS